MLEQLKEKKKLLLLGAAIVFVIVMSVWIGLLLNENGKLNDELRKVEQESQNWQEENAALEALVDEENETALMEEYARKAGYVYADERVYINGS